MNLKQKIRAKLIKFLDVDMLENNIKTLQDYNNLHNTHIENLTDTTNELVLRTNKIHNTLENIVNIGVDVDARHDGRSWAVICIEGNMNIVKFVDLNRSDARHVMDFLKSFEVSKRLIDAPKGLFDFRF